MFKFEVGESIILVSSTHPEYNGEYLIEDIIPPKKHEGIARRAVSGGLANYPRYDLGIVSINGNNLWAWESELRKKHRPATKSFSGLMTELGGKVIA